MPITVCLTGFFVSTSALRFPEIEDIICTAPLNNVTSRELLFIDIQLIILFILSTFLHFTL